MPVIAVVNRKGGSGKSTVAAHLAAWCAQQGSAVMLGDVDRQQSTRAWLRRRDVALPVIAPWTVDQKNVLRVPHGITHVVLDTPGGLQGFDLARMVMFADAVLMPVCSSAFDREAAQACHAELMTLPRVASGRCKLAAIGMRIDARTHSANMLKSWAASLSLPFLGVLRETQLYVQSLERGMTIFDLPPQRAEVDLAQWAPIQDWLMPLLYPVQAANDPSPTVPLASSRLASPPPRSSSLMPAQESMVHGSRLAEPRMPATSSIPVRALDPAPAPRPTGPAERQPIPAFLRQQQS